MYPKLALHSKLPYCLSLLSERRYEVYTHTLWMQLPSVFCFLLTSIFVSFSFCSYLFWGKVWCSPIGLILSGLSVSTSCVSFWIASFSFWLFGFLLLPLLNFFVIVFTTGFLCVALLSWNSLFRAGWPQTHRSTCLLTKMQGVCHHGQLIYMLLLMLLSLYLAAPNPS